MFEALESISTRPKPFAFYTADELWTDEHTAKRMLAFHLNKEVDLSSRNGAFITRSVDWLISHFRLGPNTSVVDFGCGPGLYTTPLARCGAQVVGVDFSENSLNYAKDIAVKEGVEIDYQQTNYLEFTTEKRFDLATMIMCDFCALSPSQRKTLLARFRELLLPDGALLLDVYSLVAFEDRAEEAKYEVNLLDGFWSPQKYHGFLHTFKYEKDKVILDKYTIIEESRTRTVYNWLQYFSRQDLEQEFAENGFAIEQCYSDVAGSSYDPNGPEFAVIAKKI